MADPVPLFDRRFDPRHGRAVAIGDVVRRITARNPGPFTFHGTNTFLVGGETEIVVIDPGPDDATHVAEVLWTIGDARVVAILLTHTHRDHTGAVAAIASATGAPVLIGAGRGTVRADAGAPRLDDARDTGLKPARFLEDGERIAVEDFYLEAIATPGHTSDHVCFALPRQRTIFTGDHVMAWSTTVVAPPDGSMAAYMASLGRIAERPERRLLPAHGPGIGEATSGEHIAGLVHHRRRRERALIETVAARPGGTVPEMVETIYTDVDRSLHGAAALSLLAHVESLVDRGLIVGDGPLDFTTRWRPTT
jgi:glyoxylase-like metal-dependent hydrolase (beta-lactamase superfamily II)